MRKNFNLFMTCKASVARHKLGLQAYKFFLPDKSAYAVASGSVHGDEIRSISYKGASARTEDVKKTLSEIS
jgi:hypothetical protein